jgi:hypothetical protein
VLGWAHRPASKFCREERGFHAIRLLLAGEVLNRFAQAAQDSHPTAQLFHHLPLE